MNFRQSRSRKMQLAIVSLVAGTALFSVRVAAQQQKDEVLRTNTELVESRITVLDKQGNFVDGLDRGQFQLMVDGKPRPISFFERISSGSPREAELAARTNATGTAVTPAAPTATVVPGRTIAFFIDDMHLEAESLVRTKQMLRHFLDHEMSSRDSVAITAASGQVGFLGQYTNNKEVLNTVIERLLPRTYEARGYGTGSTVMKEFDALIIDSAATKATGDVYNFYLRECIVQSNPPKQVAAARAAIVASCDTQVRNSARAVLVQAGTITKNMYASLESLMRSAARAPGRKIAFFVSDGFLLDAGPHSPDLRGRLDSVIDTAQKAGVVVYTIDSRGLSSDGVDLKQGNARPDVGRPLGEIETRQNAMNALAGDTGGRALRNQNYFDKWVGKVLDETSNYYLLAWRPDTDTEKIAKFRNLKISVLGRPELTVRAPRGYVEGAPATVDTTRALEAGNKPKGPEGEIVAALNDYHSSDALPTLLSLTYLNTPANGPVITSSMQIANRGISYGDDGKQAATIKLAGVVLNDKGKVLSSFKNQLNLDPPNGGGTEGGVIYNQHTPLAPGIYQVRVAARDEKSGRVGSAMEWIVIPDLTKSQLTLSSLLLGGQVLENTTAKGANPQVQLSVDHRFARSAPLGYWVFVYNARRDAAGKTQLTAQTCVLRNGQPVITSPQRKLGSDTQDPKRIPFGDEVALKTLAPGSYELRVTITDGIAGTSVTRTIDFTLL
ncbi:MAG TPA: VWA domain-containing protein [Pyrinomonadaceae bacterium]|nr:VWA domain-containing protein [Pyrinomonadaceae bacterium]